MVQCGKFRRVYEQLCEREGRRWRRERYHAWNGRRCWKRFRSHQIFGWRWRYSHTR
jgi:hypothetical protein